MGTSLEGYYEYLPMPLLLSGCIWMNFKNDKAGMFLSAEKIVIDGGKKKRTRK